MDPIITVAVFASAGTALIIVSLAVSAWVLMKRARTAKRKKSSDKILSDFKSRFLREQIINADLDHHILETDDQLLYMEEIERKEYMKRQSKRFLECALNLMAHSYDNFEEARIDAFGILHQAFEDEYEFVEDPWEEDDGRENDQ